MLNRMRELFIECYVLTRNATKSAEEAGYSKKTAYSQGQRLLKNVEIASIVDRRLKEMFEKKFEKLEITNDNIIKLLWDIAQVSKRDSDRVQSLNILSKINGMQKEAATQNVSIFSQYADELRRFRPTTDEKKEAVSNASVGSNELVADKLT